MHFPKLITMLCVLLVACLLANARHIHKHHKRAASIDEIEYRDTVDYEGIAIDRQPIKTTTEPKELLSHQRTNRFPKLRKFFADAPRYYH